MLKSHNNLKCPRSGFKVFLEKCILCILHIHADFEFYGIFLTFLGLIHTTSKIIMILSALVFGLGSYYTAIVAFMQLQRTTNVKLFFNVF